MSATERIYFLKTKFEETFSKSEKKPFCKGTYDKWKRDTSRKLNKILTESKKAKEKAREIAQFKKTLEEMYGRG